MGFRLLFITLLFAVLNLLSAESDWRKAAELRRNSEYSQAEKLLKKYTAVPYIFEIVIFALLFELALIVFLNYPFPVFPFR